MSQPARSRGSFFEDDFAGLAIADLDGVDDAGAVLGADDDAVEQDEDGQREVEIEQRLGGGELDDASLLIEAVEAAARSSVRRALRVSVCGESAGWQQQVWLADFFARAEGFAVSAAAAAASGDGVAVTTGTEHVEARSLAQGENGFGRFVHGVALDQAVAVDAVDGAAAGVEQAQVVVDLGGRGDGGAGIARGVLLLDGDGRSEAVDLVHVGLLDALEKLARVGGERLDVAALALGVDGVEGQRGLLPEPDTPLTTVSFPWGISQEMFFRLWVRAPRMMMASFKGKAPEKRMGGISVASERLRAQPAILYYRGGEKGVPVGNGKGRRSINGEIANREMAQHGAVQATCTGPDLEEQEGGTIQHAGSHGGAGPAASSSSSAPWERAGRS